MAGIPEDTLTTWATIGAQKTSKDTYATVKLALEADDTPYVAMSKAIFLQGSYGNDTNIVKESDVDVVIRLDSIFTYDIDSLPANQQAAFNAAYQNSVYTYSDFRSDVLGALTARFKGDVDPGTKAVVIKPRNNRRKADVLIATQHKAYTQYTGTVLDEPVIGIAFFKSDGTRVVNYPRQHRENLVAKNQNTNEWFKHLVRIFKNARQDLIDQNVVQEGVAPSYYIEGLLYNVPNENFGTSYEASFENVLRWLSMADISTFICANEQYPLLDGNPDVTWNTANCTAYISGLIALWNNW